jgi:peroxiredoxin
MQAPELISSQWFNAPDGTRLSDYLGKVVIIEAFQMLCPGCVLHGIPLAQSVQQTFPTDTVQVLGLHCVFEHHAAMTPVSLEAFLHEYRVTFPVAVDAPGDGHLPQTMEAYGLRGTPSLLIIDQKGALRGHHFGQLSELRLGAEIATLLSEKGAVPSTG